MADAFEGYQSGLESPAANVAVVTPNDSADLANVSRALGALVSGIVYVDALESGTNVPIFVVAGSQHVGRFTRVYSTGTTATGIVSYW